MKYLSKLLIALLLLQSCGTSTSQLMITSGCDVDNEFLLWPGGNETPKLVVELVDGRSLYEFEELTGYKFTVEKIVRKNLFGNSAAELVVGWAVESSGFSTVTGLIIYGLAPGGFEILIQHGTGTGASGGLVDFTVNDDGTIDETLIFSNDPTRIGGQFVTHSRVVNGELVETSRGPIQPLATGDYPDWWTRDCPGGQ